MDRNVFHTFRRSFYLTLSLLAVWSASFLTVNAERRPGLVTRHSDKYLSMYHQEVILGTQLNRKLKQSIEFRTEGKALVNIWSQLNYSLHSVIVTGYSRPKANVSITTANGISLQMSVAEIALQGKYKVDLYNGPWLQFSRSGNMSMSVLGTSLRMQRQILLTDNKEKIKWKSSHCSASVKDVEIEVDDPKLKVVIANLDLREQIKSLEYQLCNISRYFLDVDVDLSNIISKDIYLNNSLLSKPVIYDDYIEYHHRGEIRYSEDSNEYPTLPKPFGVLQSNKMITYRISEFSFNSFWFVYHNHNLLSCTYTKSDLPTDRQHLLNTTCEENCFGNLFPIESLKYPGLSVEMNISTVEQPHVEITPGLLKALFELDTNINVRESNDSTARLFSVHLLMSASVRPSIKKNRIYFEMQHSSLNITRVCTRTLQSNLEICYEVIGSHPDENLLVMLKLVLDKVFVPILSDFKTNGFDLKIPKGLSIRKYEWKLSNGELSLLIDLDEVKKCESFVYLPKERFKPRCFGKCYDVYVYYPMYM